MPSKRGITGLAALVACALVVPGCGGAEARRPNVALVVFDTVRRDHLSTYGAKRETSPALDRLAASSVVFEQATSAAPWTLPSHAGLFTGLLPSRHQAHHEHLGLDEGRTTLAERLRAVGYDTAGICNNPWITETTGMARGFDHYVEPWRTRVSKGTFNINVFPDEDKHGITDAGAAASLDEIASWLGARDDDAPFFLFVNVIEAHSFYAPPPEYRGRFMASAPSAEEVKQLNAQYLRAAHMDRLPERAMEAIQALYDAEIAYVDDWFDRFVELLRAQGELDETLLVVTSDHGEGFGEHRRCGIALVDHQLSLFEELIAVPLIVRFPSSHAAASRHGERVATPVSTLDVLPTILDVAGLPVPSELDGLSLAASAGEEPRVITSEYFRPLVHLDLLEQLGVGADEIECLADRRVASVRIGDAKLIADSRDEVLYFDLASDPGETLPLDPDQAPAALVEGAREALRRMESSFDVAPPRELDDAQQAALQALGYM